ncbi:MAG TPA: ATP-binding cassette domain-containing protein, partial [Acidimicrobiales bacterium]|nr:ATP-binding cassette domain-containing protein [Acidimicrobiales bacterium]
SRRAFAPWGNSRRPVLMRSPLAWLSALLLAYLVLPLVLFLARLAGSPKAGFSTPGLFSALATSAEAATISATLVGLAGIPLSYMLARRRGRLSSLAGLAVQLPLALPPLMSGVVLLYLVGPDTFLGRLSGGRLTESLAGIVLAQSFVASPFLVVAARSSFAAVDNNLEDTAATLGLSPLARFWRVALPLAAPGIRAGLLLAWLRAFGEYGATVMLAYHPYSLPVFTYVQFSAVGLPPTQAPTALAIGLAAAVIALSHLPLPRLRKKEEELQGACAPLPRRPLTVSFDLSMTAGTFRLELSHSAASHRLAIVGPSGAGKSLTLRCLAGLFPGQVSFGASPVGHLPPEARSVGYVPQGQSLMPHLSAFGNVVLGPHANRGLAAWWFDALGLGGLEGRSPAELSGGQRQRVALARAFACEPSVVLLDEPFSGLDAPQRVSLRKELRRLQLEAGLSSVLVTHDPEEAALLADEILVIACGQALQAGPLVAVLSRPASPEVAAILGFGNIFPGVVASPLSLRSGGTLIATGPHGLLPGAALTWCVQPEFVDVTATEKKGAKQAEVTDVAVLGASSIATVSLEGGLEMEAKLSSGDLPSTGGRCWVRIPPEAILTWPSDPTERV